MPSNNGLNDYAMFIRIALTEEFMGGGGGGWAKDCFVSYRTG